MSGNGLSSDPKTYKLKWDSHYHIRGGIAPGNGRALFFGAIGAAVSSFQFKDLSTGDKTKSIYVAPSLAFGVDYALSDKLALRTEVIFDLYEHGTGCAMMSDYEAELQNAVTIETGIGYSF